MKTQIFTLALFFAVFGIADAQVPEFGLKVKFFRENATVPNKTVAFGFDATASDTLEGSQKWFPELSGEQFAPPAGFDWDFRMAGTWIARYSDLQTGSYVDIRKKPNDTSFMLLFELDMIENDFTTAHIEWDNLSIPSKITHIILESYHPPFVPRLDMKNTSSFAFSSRDSIQFYGSMLIKVYYNQEPAAVKDRYGNSPDKFTLYPNPMDSKSKMHFISNKDSRLIISAYDIAGRKMLERTVDAQTGENEFEFNRGDFAAHSGIYLIRFHEVGSGKQLDRYTTLIVR